MWRRPSPRQLPGGLAGCLCNGFNASLGLVASYALSQLSRANRSRENEDLDEELRQVIDAPSLEAAVLRRQVGRRVSPAEAAIAASDASMCKGLHRVSQFPEWPVQDMSHDSHD